ncbi:MULTISPECIES: hypothetical protein [unclassified Flavobacterium]|uniref:hypothetical protein n=1 Tax=unclassified Flavobacterium TaxID=196869 RepID=UPI0020910F2B|nr:MULTISPECIES: hypothetical protein [unclassified Flavobacterium]MCO6163805.1 hypothetical protein [Flavobacterium sp. NRK F7]|tara:strand:+ start:1494 stop:1994 length:501 start_codon:yes stop_codon:yes gene_type:complete
MKKVIIALALISNCIAFAQIKVIETTPVVRLGSIGQNDMFIQHEGEEYTFFYKNVEKEEETNTRSFSFKDLDNDFAKLQEIIVSGFNADPLLDIKLELPNQFVWLHYSKNLDRTFVQFMSKNKNNEVTGVSKAFTLSQIDKLFEKKATNGNSKGKKKGDDVMSEFK